MHCALNFPLVINLATLSNARQFFSSMESANAQWVNQTFRHTLLFYCVLNATRVYSFRAESVALNGLIKCRHITTCCFCASVGSANNNKLSLVGIQEPEQYKEKFAVSSEGPSPGVTSGCWENYT